MAAAIVQAPCLGTSLRSNSQTSLFALPSVTSQATTSAPAALKSLAAPSLLPTILSSRTFCTGAPKNTPMRFWRSGTAPASVKLPASSAAATLTLRAKLCGVKTVTTAATLIASASSTTCSRKPPSSPVGQKVGTAPLSTTLARGPPTYRSPIPPLPPTSSSVTPKTIRASATITTSAFSTTTITSSRPRWPPPASTPTSAITLLAGNCAAAWMINPSEPDRSDSPVPFSRVSAARRKRQEWYAPPICNHHKKKESSCEIESSPRFLLSVSSLSLPPPSLQPPPFLPRPRRRS